MSEEKLSEIFNHEEAAISERYDLLKSAFDRISSLEIRVKELENKNQDKHDNKKAELTARDILKEWSEFRTDLRRAIFSADSPAECGEGCQSALTKIDVLTDKTNKLIGGK